MAIGNPTFPKRPLLTVSAAMVLVAIVFSYLFLLGVAALCVLAPAALLGKLADRNSTWWVQSLMLLVAGAVIAAVILWSLVPRRNRFQAPGVEIQLELHPKLQRLIRETTDVLSERMPDAVYVCADANAAVIEHGGFMGMRRRRVLSLGLPLVATLTLEELKAAIAHECAHYYTGDTWLSPWVYGTRTALWRTITNLAGESPFAGLLSRFGLARTLHLLVITILTWYWELLLRFCAYVSRAQEYRSDELSAFIAGASAADSGLRRISLARMVEGTFWRDVIYPALEGGVLPDLSESFRRLEALPEVAKACAELLETRIATETVDAQGSHPPLRLRLERLAKLSGSAPWESGEHSSGVSERADSVFDDLEVIERNLAASVFPNINKVSLRRADWSAVGSTVYIPAWRELVVSHSHLLGKSTILEIPELLARSPELAGLMHDEPGTLLTREQRAGQVRALIWKAFALRLIEAGWTLEVAPGVIEVKRDGEYFSPRQLIDSIASGATSREGWGKFCDARGLSEVMLAENPTLVERGAGL